LGCVISRTALPDLNKSAISSNQQESLLEFIELKIPPLNAKQDHFLSIGRFVDQILENWND
jgi:hypothetical protein